MEGRIQFSELELQYINKTLAFELFLPLLLLLIMFFGWH